MNAVMNALPLEGELMPRNIMTESRVNGELVGMTDLEIKTQAPAVFGRQHSSLSEAYAFVRTGNIVRQMRELGFAVQSVKQTKPRRRDPSTVRHAVTLVRAEDLSKNSLQKVGRPTIMLMNSNNGRSKFRFMFGYFRLVCSNGLVIGEVAASMALIHRAGEIAQLDKVMKEINERHDRARLVIERWRGIQLGKATQQMLALEMAKLRFGNTAGKYDMESALRVRRPEDEGDDLWTVFNRLQESYVRGGVAYAGNAGDVRSSRPIDGVVADTGFNLAAWSVAERIAATVSGEGAAVVVN
jgi:hypothetical protein